MEIYKNDYSKNEDEMMWELHEIRHKLWDDIKDKELEEINNYSHNLLEKWKKDRYLSFKH